MYSCCIINSTPSIYVGDSYTNQYILHYLIGLIIQSRKSNHSLYEWIEWIVLNELANKKQIKTKSHLNCIFCSRYLDAINERIYAHINWMFGFWIPPNAMQFHWKFYAAIHSCVLLCTNKVTFLQQRFLFTDKIHWNELQVKVLIIKI